MNIFIDTLDLAYIKKYAKLGLLAGVTTNPTFSKNYGMYDDVNTVKKIRKVLGEEGGEIHIEILGNTATEIVKKAKALTKDSGDKNLVFKIPFSEVALHATKMLNKLKYKTNIHLIYSANQALFASKVQPTYICPLFGRIDDTGTNAVEQIRIMNCAYSLGANTLGYIPKILIASIRTPKAVAEFYRHGLENITIPPSVLDMMWEHPLTEKGIIQFKKDVKNEL